MMPPDDGLWTLEELGERVAEGLAVGYDGVPSGRVRDVPDARTIRYYHTLGLVDRPAEMRGRTAFYGRRHLLQILAIKRLQARGSSLAEVQQALVGLPDADLERLAGPPPAAPRSATFWKQRPAPMPASAPEVAGPAPGPAPAFLQGVPLDPHVTLLVRPRRAIGEEDLRTIRMAAAPLLELLRLKGLIGPDGPGAADDEPPAAAR